MSTTPAEDIIARHIAGALRDILFPDAPSTPIIELPYEATSTAAIVAAECIAELEGAGHVPTGPALGYCVVVTPEGMDPEIRNRKVMSCAAAIESVGRSDLPRDRRHLLCEIREVQP